MATNTNIRSFRADEWAVHKALRLRALREDPDAFASTLDHALTNSDSRWRDRLAEVVESPFDLALLAENDGTPAGLLWVRFDDAERQLADLYQMWVAPEFRGGGLGEAMVRDALDWAKQVGATAAILDVTYGDSPASRLYERCGFRATGDPGPLRDGADLLALPMRIDLALHAA